LLKREFKTFSDMGFLLQVTIKKEELLSEVIGEVGVVFTY
jgi:hypothetical protein